MLDSVTWISKLIKDQGIWKMEPTSLSYMAKKEQVDGSAGLKTEK